MKKRRYTENQIFQVIKEAEAGIPVPGLCRKHGMSNANFYKWRAKYGGLDGDAIVIGKGAGRVGDSANGAAPCFDLRRPFLARRRRLHAAR